MQCIQVTVIQSELIDSGYRISIFFSEANYEKVRSVFFETDGGFLRQRSYVELDCKRKLIGILINRKQTQLPIVTINENRFGLILFALSCLIKIMTCFSATFSIENRLKKF